jgi:hypothetical protein
MWLPEKVKTFSEMGMGKGFVPNNNQCSGNEQVDGDN